METDNSVYQFIIENVSSLISRHTLDGTYLFASSASRSLLGYEPEELVGRSAYDFFHADDVGRIRQAHEETLGQLGVAQVVYRIRHKLGHFVWFETISRVIMDEAAGVPVEIVATSNDITLFKQTEDALARTVSLHQATLESTADGILVVDENGRIVNHNRKFQKMWRIPDDVLASYEDDKALAYVVGQLRNPDTFVQKVRELYAKPEAESYDRLWFKDGRVFDRYSQPQRVGKRVVGRVWSFRNVTEQVHVQEQARSSAQRFQRLINQAADGIFLLDQMGQVVDVNERACLNLGYSHKELLRLTVFDFNVDLTHEMFAALVKNLSLDKATIVERLHRRRDGSLFPVEISMGLMETGEILSVARDITQRRKTAQALRESEERFRSLANATTEGVVIHENGRIVELNQAMAQMLGYEVEELIGRNIVDTVPPEGKQLVAQNLEQAAAEPYETVFWHKDGSELMVEVCGKAIPYLGRPMRVVTVRNVTQQKALEEDARLSLWRRSREVRLTTQIAQEIAGISDLRELYQRVVTLVHEQFGYYHTQLFRCDVHRHMVSLVVGYGEAGERMLAFQHSLPVGVGLVGTAVARGHSMLRSDVTNDPDWRPNPVLPLTKGELAVPIKLRDEVLGVLDVQSDVAGALNDNDKILLEGLCGQIAVAIESARLGQEMEVQLRETAVLQRQRVQEGWARWQPSETGARGFVFDTIENQIRPARGNGWSDDMGNLAPQSVNKPLAIRGTAIGRLTIDHDPGNPLTPEEEAFLESISEQVAEALESARLFEQTQSALAVQERLAQELRTVSEVSTVAATIRESYSLLQSVVDLTKVSFDLYHVHIFLLSEDEQYLLLAAGADDVGRLMREEDSRVSISSRSIIAKAARTREPVIVADAATDEDFLLEPLLPETRSELAVPMIVGTKLLGVLDVQSDQPHRFTDEDVLINRTLASQVAVALQNAYLYDEQVQAAERLREVDRLKTEFLASMSHELRTPLNSIIGFADVLLEGVDGELNQLMQEDVKLIRDSGEHLRTLIDDILDMSKIEAGKMELRYERIDMYQMAHDIISTATPLAKEKGLRLNLFIHDDDIVVEADRTRLRQILWNIVGNGIKFTKQGQVTLTIEKQNGNLLVAVTDTGIGIRPEDIGIVFEQFRQVDGKLNREAGGTGLGMPISKNLVELHGGRIWLESRLGEGSKFYFTVPLQRQDVKKP